MKEPLFRIYTPWAARSYKWMSLAFFMISVYNWFVNGPYIQLFVVSFAVLGISLLPYRFLSRQLVQEALFCENSFIVRGKNLDRKIPYSDMVEVSLVKSPYFLRSRVRITLRSEEDAIFIYWNQKSRKLQTDLFSWLKGKIGTVQAQGN